MIITKRFTIESAHIVRNCTSERCSHSIHGHSAKIEISFECDTLDNAGMVYDFGLMTPIKNWIDSMDHCYLLWRKDDYGFKKFIKESCDRWIELPFNPSAEMLSLFIMKQVQDILDKTIKTNGEGNIRVCAVRYWETETGSATATETPMDMNLLDSINLKDINYSAGVIKDWSKDLIRVFEDKKINNPKAEAQVSVEND